jgi:magnesium-transporting ATPase (P-type)
MTPLPERQEHIETLPVGEVFRMLRTAPGGLDTGESAARLERFGPNTIAVVRKASLTLKLLANFVHLMAMLLWIAGFVALAARMPQLAVSIWTVNVINGLFSFWQEFRAERATRAMLRMLPEKATVLRDGKSLEVEARGLVPGDVLVLAEGGRICADARLVDSAELRVDQSTLTGESLDVRKTHEPFHAGGRTRIETPNLVFAGTNVVSGTGRGVVLATGMETEFGRIAGVTQSLGGELSPLQKEMRRVTRTVTVIAACSGAAFFALAVSLAGMDPAEGFIFGMGMIVAFVPEGLLPTVTLSLAMGVQRMARRHALVKRLSAVETLGCASVICTDKTGTLTRNEMTVREIWTPSGAWSVTGTGYAPEGEIRPSPDRDALPDETGLRLLLTTAALCNNARLLPPEGTQRRWSVIGDPTEGALLVAARKAGLDLEREAHAAPRNRELPFESRRKRMSTLHRTGGRILAHVKGAPREVLSRCSHLLVDGSQKPLGDEDMKRVMDAVDAYARDGLRVLGMARRTLPEGGGGTAPDAESVERDLTFLGLAAMMDPPRPEVRAAVKTCRRAGIRIVMITGDYGLTAEAVARRIGIVRGRRPRMVSGADLQGMNDGELARILDEEVIFARVDPGHKLRIVSALQRAGHVVAVTGDGVNDAPALKKADIGIAMGVSGVDVAREAADMVLADDNFASIVGAIEEGRAVYANIKKFTSYIFTSNTPEAVPFILHALSGGRIPLALGVMHILAVDLGTDLLPALALGAEPPEPGLMDRPPRNLNEHVITRGLLMRAYLFLGPLQSAAVMAAFFFRYWTGGHPGQWLDLPAEGPLYASATAMALACVVTTQIGNLFAQRTERASTLSMRPVGNRLLWWGILSELAGVAAVVYWPPAQRLVGTQAFPLSAWPFLFAWTPLLLLADEARKLFLRAKAEKQSPGGGS